MGKNSLTTRITSDLNELISEVQKKFSKETRTLATRTKAQSVLTKIFRESGVLGRATFTKKKNQVQVKL